MANKLSTTSYALVVLAIASAGCFGVFSRLTPKLASGNQSAVSVVQRRSDHASDSDGVSGGVETILGAPAQFGINTNGDDGHGYSVNNVSIVILGDSLVAGAFYTETKSDPKLRFTERPWTRSFREAFLRTWNGLAMRQEDNADGDKRGAVKLRIRNSSLSVHSYGFPGRRIRGLERAATFAHAGGAAQKKSSAVARQLQTADIVVILAGTNDIISDDFTASSAVKELYRLHATVRRAAKRRRPNSLFGKEGGPVTVAVMPPPVLMAIQPWAFGFQSKTRAYCHADRDGVTRQHRAAFLSALLPDTSATADRRLASCASTAVMYGIPLSQGNKSASSAKDVSHNDLVNAQPSDVELSRRWSDCLHPNEEGYAAFGQMIGQDVARIVAQGRGCRL